MAIYDLNGTQINNAYNLSAEINNAYDIQGQHIFSKTPVVLKVMAFNVGSFYTEWHPCPDNKSASFYQRHTTIFNAQQPDIAGLPEWYKYIGTYSSDTFMSDHFESYVANYEAYKGNTNPNHAITFSSTYPMSNNTIVAYQSQGSETRYYQKGYITVNGHNIRIVNTHLDLNGTARGNQFAELLTMLENETYFICTGDFNFQIQAVGDSQYNASVQLALNKGFNSAQNSSGIYLTWYDGQTAQTSTTIHALDNIITSANLPISNVAVDTTKLTDGLCSANSFIIDHLPLVAKVTVS